MLACHDRGRRAVSRPALETRYHTDSEAFARELRARSRSAMIAANEGR